MCVLSAILLSAPKPALSNFQPVQEPRHPVTEAMLSSAAQKAKSPAPDFSLPDAKGNTFRLGDFSKQMPVVIVSTLTDCPCTMESQPIWNTFAKGLQGKVQFFGLARNSAAEISEFSTNFEVPYPILIDANKEIIKELNVPNSVYVVIVSQDGKIYKIWPGYSKAMVQEMNEILSKLASTKEVALKISEVPDKLASGCTL